MDINSSLIEATREDLVQKTYELGYLYEQKCGYCPQAALAAIMDVLDIRDDTLFRSAYPFHGGGANSGIGTCGALCGGMLAVSYLFGRSRLEFNLAQKNGKATVLCGKLVEQFQEEYGCVICRDVQKVKFGRSFDLNDKEDLKVFMEMGGHEDKCPDVVGKGASLAVGIIWDAVHKIR